VTLLMRPAYSHPLGPLAAPSDTESAATQTTLRGSSREALLPRLRTKLVNPEDEVLLEDEHGQPWVDRPIQDQDGRELAQVSWREVCLNWPDAMCNDDTDKK
jgi:hypothetical protein